MDSLITLRSSLEEIAKHVSALGSSLSERQLETFVQLIAARRKVFAYGAGRSGLMIKAFVQRLNQIGMPAFFIGDTFTPSFGEDDMLVAISGSGETESTACLVKKAKAMHGVIVVLTANSHSRIAEMADLVVSIPGKTIAEKGSAALIMSLFEIAALSTLDSIVAELMKRRGVTEEEILKRHATLE